MSIEYIREIHMKQEVVQKIPKELEILEFYLDEYWDTMTPRFVNWKLGDAAYKVVPMQLR